MNLLILKLNKKKVSSEMASSTAFNYSTRLSGDTGLSYFNYLMYVSLSQWFFQYPYIHDQSKALSLSLQNYEK